MESLLYISSARIDGADVDDRIADLVAAAQERNAALDVTGALLFTGSHFAQILEGDAGALAALMRSICADTRHADVRVIETTSLSERRFDGWSLAYLGQAQYVRRHIDRVLADEPAAVAALKRLLREMHNAGGVLATT